MAGPWEKYKEETAPETAAKPWEQYQSAPKTKKTDKLGSIRAALISLARGLTFGQSDKIAASMLGLNEEEAKEYKQTADRLIEENPNISTAAEAASYIVPGMGAIKGAKVAGKAVKKGIDLAKHYPDKALGAAIAASGDPITGAAVGLLGRQFAKTRGQRAMSKGFGWLEKKGKKEAKEKAVQKAKKKIAKQKKQKTPATKQGLKEALKPRIRMKGETRVFDQIQQTVKNK